MTILLFEEKINDNKRINLSLKECLGIGKTLADKLYYTLGLNNRGNHKLNAYNSNNTLFKRLLDNIEQKVLYLNEFIVCGDKKKVLEKDLKKLKKSNCLRWRRHFQKLPVRNQHSRTNARTQKSKRGFRRGLPIASKKKQV